MQVYNLNKPIPIMSETALMENPAGSAFSLMALMAASSGGLEQK